MQLNLDIHGELIIDNFAGGGGASTGIELALGRRVDIAINHDPEAVAMHTANHPETKHYCESVWEIDPREVTQGRPVGLVWLSPDCKHFSKAKGGKPVEKKIRGLAWVALRWADVAKPRVIMLENVEEFRTWGPLIIDGEGKAKPCPKNKGREFNSFCNALRRHGYHVEHRELRACDYGTPTIRKRLFLIARRDGQPIVWPEPTHGDPRNIATKANKLKPWRTAAECIDFTIPCPSIFERKRELAPATLRRIAKGIMRYVVNASEPFIVPLTHHGADRRYDLANPLPTVTAAHRGEMALVAPVLTEHANASTPRCMPVDEPLRTICAQTKGGHHALIAPTLVQTGYGERDGQAPRALDMGKPLGTLVGSQKHALVSAFMAKHYGGVVGHSLQGEPLHTVTSTDHNSLVTAILEPANGSNGRIEAANRSRITGGQAGRDDLETGKARQPATRDSDHSEARREHWKERLPHGEDGVDGEVISDVSPHRRLYVAGRTDHEWNGHQSPGRQQDKQSTGEHGADNTRRKSRARSQDRIEECVGGNSKGLDHSEEVKAFLVAYYGSDQDPRLEEPLHTVTTKDRYGLVTVAGEEYQIADIGLRMLAPKELFKAQGFPDSYITEWGINPEGQRINLTKSAQVRMCGNSVCPPLASALVRANLPELAITRKAA